MTSEQKMKELYLYQTELLKSVNQKFTRFLHSKIAWDQKMIAIKGPRGSGKTTLMLQQLKYGIRDKSKSLFINVEHPWFLTHSLFDTAQQFYQNGGRYLFIDEIHKYENWSRELKVIYDGFPDLQVVFSASSALDIYRGSSDLSRRVLTYELPGLSFREYLEFIHGLKFKKISLPYLFENHYNIASAFSEKAQFIPMFRQYLKTGYYPVTKKTRQALYLIYVFNTMNTVLEQDLQMANNLTAAAIHKLKKLLGIIAQSVPFEPNISSIARKSGTGRNTVIEFLSLLERARIINFLVRDQFGISALQKPDKIYIENTNMMFAIDESPNKGTIRETFLMNQLHNSNFSVRYPQSGDFIVDKKFIIEVGGKNKHVSDKNIFIAMDDIEVGFGNTIPLWLFGFLY